MITRGTSFPADIDSVDLQTIESVRPNLLLCGPAGAVDRTLASLMPSLQQPVFNWVGDDPRSLPHELTGTLIFAHASTAPGEQQRLLLEWLGTRSQHVQVISTSEEPLFALVQQGAFLDRLFYRLNTLYLDLGCPDWSAPSSISGSA